MDVFYTSSTDQAGEVQPGVAHEVAAGALDRAHGMVPYGSAAQAAQAAQTTQDAQVAAPQTAAAALEPDAAAQAVWWQQWLEQAGFSRAEAARLIFERVCPRAEGLVRG